MPYAKKTAREKEIVEELLRKNPETGSQTLAKMLVKELPKMFPSMEVARSRIRYLRGAMGAAHRKKMGARTFVQPLVTRKLPERAIPSLPPSAMRKPAPYLMAASNSLVISDAHFPYHDVEALELALEHGEKNKVNGIVLLGDMLDCHTLSDHEQDPEARDMNEELESCRQFLSHLRARFPKAQIVYREGNHEARQRRFLMRNARAYIGCPEFRLDVLLRLMDHRIDWVGERRKIKMGPHLTLLHGDEFVGNFGGVNPARNMFMKAKTCVMSGHNHRTSEHTERALDDRVITCWSLGCLCELSPLYMPYNNWNLGFGHVSLEKDDFRVDNKRIIRVGGSLKIY